MKNQTYQEFAEILYHENFFDEYIQESVWTSDRFKSSTCESMMEAEAVKRAITLTHQDDFDGDKFFEEIYDTTEKGLS